MLQQMYHTESPVVQKFRPHLSKFHALFVPLSIYLFATVKTLAKTPKFKILLKKPRTFNISVAGCC